MPPAGVIEPGPSGHAAAQRNARVRRRIRLDIAVSLFVATIVYLLSVHFNYFERFTAYSRTHENLQLDELASLVVVAAIAGLVFALRRTRELLRELTLRSEAESQMRRMAMLDPLTGLANRRRLLDELVHAIRARKDDGVSTCLLMIDLDRFKPINDTHGHGVGNDLLVAVGERLQRGAREDELVARLGGDEFAVLMPRVRSAEAAARAAHRMLDLISAPFVVGHLTLQVGISIGVDLTADRSADPETVLHHADLALYGAKREERGEFRFYEPTLDREVRERARLELALREAIRSDAIDPHYQPVVELNTGRIKGFEMLARWVHPTDGLIPPKIFIPIADDNGLIGELCMRLLHRACREAATWPEHQVLAMNLAPRQLRDPHLADRLLEVLRQENFPPSRLEIEITENALVEDFDRARDLLLQLKAHGVGIVLDDFGTGSASLLHLRDLPFDVLKIDRSFIMSMNGSDDSRRLVDAIVGLSQSLGLETVAEGIEDAAVLSRLNRLGCELGQGFLYGHPDPDVRVFSATNRPEVPVPAPVLQPG